MAKIDMPIGQFIEEKCRTNKHYGLAREKPERFNGWRENRAIRSLYYNWIMSDSNCPSLKLDILFPHQEVLDEVLAQRHRFVKHRGGNHPGWYSMTIHGQGVEFTDPKHEYPDTDAPYDWTELAAECPVTVDWLKSTWPFYEYDRVRFMLLKPGGWISPHQDFETRKLAAYNVAISNPPGVEFAMEEADIIPWKVGDVRAIDIGRLHTVRHTGTEDRIHMIIHGKPHAQHQELMCRSYDILNQELIALHQGI